MKQGEINEQAGNALSQQLQLQLANENKNTRIPH